MTGVLVMVMMIIIVVIGNNDTSTIMIYNLSSSVYLPIVRISVSNCGVKLQLRYTADDPGGILIS